MEENEEQKDEIDKVVGYSVKKIYIFFFSGQLHTDCLRGLTSISKDQ